MLQRSGGLRAALMMVTAAALIQGCGEKDGDRRDQSGPQPASVTILFSSDMLGRIRSCGCTVEDSGGLGRRATYTEQLRAEAREVLVLDAGDAFSFDVSFSKQEAELTLESYNLMGVDVFTPGETEFIFGLPFLKSTAENAEFEMIAANIVDPATGKPVFGKPYTVITLRGGLRIGVTGVLDESIKFPAYIDRSKFDIKPAERTLRRVARMMERDADFLVLLSHMGVDRTKDLLSRISNFDIAIIGHDKPLMKQTEKIGKTVLLGTGGLGQYLGRIDLELSPGGTIKYGRMRLVPLPEEIEIHPGIEELFSVYKVPLTDKEAGRH
jgi:2',3'-cyclic-nucleotide 2'-phosphodiesterase (5'-nucleotidase family)